MNSLKGDSLPADIHLPASAEARLEATKSPEAAKVTLTDDWGLRDQPAIVEFVLERYKGYKLVMMGHSLGGKSFLFSAHDQVILWHFCQMSYALSSCELSLLE